MAEKSAKDNRILSALQHRILPASYIPIILVFTLVHLLSYSSKANIDIDKTFGRYLWYAVVILLTLYPAAGCIRLAWKKNRLPAAEKAHRRYPGRTVQNIILLLGIITSHIVTGAALYQGEIDAPKFCLLLMYDLILFGSWYYWSQERTGFAAGFEILAVMLWVSALYGIAEHFFYGQIPWLYENIDQGKRVISVFANAIPASSMWLMGMWLPFPGAKKHLWINILAKACFALAIFFAGGKNGWLGLVLSGIIGLVFFIREETGSGNTGKIRRLLLGAGIILVAGIFLASQFGEYFEFVMRRLDEVQTQGSFLARMQHIQDTVQYMRAAPLLQKLFGFGYATSWQFVEDSPHYYGTTLRCIDNQFFTSLFEFGLFSWVCIGIWACRLFTHLHDRDRLIRGASLGLFAMLVPLFSYDPFRWEIIMAVFLPLSVVMLSGKPVAVPWRKVLVTVFAAAVLVGSGLILVPKAIRAFRTISQHYAVKLHLQPHTFEILLMAAAVLIAVVVFVSFYLLLFRGKRAKGVRIEVAFLCAGLIAGGMLAAGTLYLLRNQMKMHSAMLEEDAQAMELIVSATDGKIVVDHDPSLYQIRFGGISPELYEGENIVRVDRTTLVTDRSNEAKKLLNVGFLFTEISDRHAVYTDDPAVQAALKKNGYHLTGYYNIERTAALHAVPEEVMPEEAAAEGSAADPGSKKIFRSDAIYLYPGIYTAALTSLADAQEDDLQLQAVKRGTLEVMGSANCAELIFAVTATKAAVDGREPVCIELAAGSEAGLPEGGPAVSVVQTPDWDVHATYDYADHKILEEYYDLSGEETAGSEGAYAVAYAYDRFLQVKERSYYDANGQLMLNTSGYARAVMKNNKYGPVKITYYGTEGKRVNVTNGSSIEKRTYDSAGNVIRYEYLSRKKKPVVINSGYAILERTFDSRKHIIREEYRGTDGELIPTPSRTAILLRDYDSEGNVTSFRYFGTDGQPVINSSSYAQLKYEFNEQRFITQETYYDTEGNPVTIPNGSAGVAFGRDVRGNAVEMTWFDVNGDPVMNTNGYAKLRRVFDAHNRITQEAYFDEAGEPVTLSTGYSLEKREYDSFGNLIFRQYCDANGNAVMHTSGYASVRYTFNSRKMIIAESYYDTEGEPVMCSGGYACTEYRRDARGNAVETSYYDTEHEPVAGTGGYAAVKRKYNRNSWVTREEYLDASGAPAALSAGQAAEEREYDSTGNIICRRYYDADGNAVMRSDGYAQVRNEYNDKRMAVKEAYFDADGNPVFLPGGYACVLYERNERGFATSYTYCDPEGAPVITTSGYARLDRSYDAHNWIIKESYFGLQGESVMSVSGYASVVKEYGEDGSVLSETRYDTQGEEIKQ